MMQPELPLVYPPVRQNETSPQYRLPRLWKAVFILLLTYSLVVSAIIYGKISKTHAETPTAPVIVAAGPAEENTAATAVGTNQVRMSATVPGWYDVIEIDNENLLLKTNMQVWVNGREFIRCGDDNGQRTAYTSLLDF
jgi:hypothetical protein